MIFLPRGVVPSLARLLELRRQGKAARGERKA